LDLSGGIPEDRSGQDALQAIRAEFDTNGIELGRDAQRIPGPERESWLIKDGVRRYLLTPKPGGFRVDELPLVRAKGAYHEIIYGDFCVHVMSVLGAWMIAVAGRPLDYAAGASGLLMAFYASLLSGTRGAWLSIPFLALLALLLYARRLRRCHWALLGTAILLAAALALILLPNVVLARFANLKNAFSAPSQVASLHERLEMWRGCLLILRDSPLLGTGLGDLKADMQRLIDRKSVDLPGATDHAHSIYFDALARMGLLGFAALVAFAFVLPFWTFFRGWRQQASPWAEFHALAGMFTVAAFALFGLTEAWFSRMPLVTTYVISLMTFLAGMANEMERRPDGVRPDED
jgi:O-antigen ligase